MSMSPQRLAYNKTEAALSLGVSVDYFDEHIAHELRCVRRGRRVMYPVAEVNAWLEREAERVQIGRRTPARRQRVG